MRRIASPVCLRTILIRGAAIALLLTIFNRCAAPAYAYTPMVFIVERDAWVYTPSGHFQVPAGTEIELCPDPDAPPVPPPPILSYDIPAFALLVPFPCELRPQIFTDGFED